MGKTVVVSGARGFLGEAVVSALWDAGHTVVALVRRDPGPREIGWDPLGGRIDETALADADVVLNLSGSSLFGNARSKRFRREAHASRVASTALLARTLAQLADPPLLVVRNVAAWYGDHGQEPVDERGSSTGDDFLTVVARATSAATTPLIRSGGRVLELRIGSILEIDAPPLRQFARLVSSGLGGGLGRGSQYLPVVSSRDWAAAARFAIERELTGIANVTCPDPWQVQRILDRLREVGDHRAVGAVPALAVRALAGPLAPELLRSLRLQPTALLRAGFHFSNPDGAAVLAQALQ